MSRNCKHFEGKQVAEHLKTAREKGAKATGEIHGTEMPGYLAAFADSLKETSILLIGMWVLLSQFEVPCGRLLSIAVLFSIGWFLWKLGRSCLLGWARLERLHRLIEQERWEITHHRSQEKEELTAMYEQKGLTGKLLQQVVEVLMADDNRLLRVMLEEELGLTLETYEHPLKQGVGGGLGVIISLSGLFLGFFTGGFLGILIVLTLLFGVITLIASKREGNEPMKSLVWNVSVGTLSTLSIYLLAKWIHHAFY